MADDGKVDLWIRGLWKVGSKCEVYSITSESWIKGTIGKIFHDTDGEWIKVQFVARKLRRARIVKRNNGEAIRPLSKAMPIYKYMYGAVRPLQSEEGYKKDNITIQVTDCNK